MSKKTTLSLTEDAVKHQLKIAASTLKMSDAGASLLGGMSKSEAAKLIARHKGKEHAVKSLKQSGHTDQEIAKLLEGKKTEQDIIAEAIESHFIVETKAPNYDDPEHKSFKRAHETLDSIHSLNPRHADAEGYVRRIDQEIESATRNRESDYPELARQISLGGAAAKEKLKRHDDHIDHLHRLRAGAKAWKPKV